MNLRHTQRSHTAKERMNKPDVQGGQQNVCLSSGRRLNNYPHAITHFPQLRKRNVFSLYGGAL